ncbi:nuclear factor of activated T-cells 5 [Brachionichthys hirsutus]|uniref:nuclear factor of activated T-cells 5 n=1 Tax=Brachionichthys hirsutus TaxID=412623 RepID=UPI003605235C
MPSDFISPFSGDLDLESSTSLYSKESVYDLLRELQLPSFAQQNPEIMSQKSGGEAGPPPPTALASDPMCSSTSDQNHVQSGTAESEDARSSRAVPEVAGAGSRSGNNGGGGNSELGEARCATSQEAQPHHHMAPSKRHTVLSISPPPQDLLDDSHMSCQDEASLDSEQSSNIWMDESLSNFSAMSSITYNDNTEVPRKSRKRTPRQRPGPKSVSAGEDSLDMFDADSAKGPHFVLSQLSTDNKTGPKGSSDGPQSTNQKGGPLLMQYPQRSEGKDLKILVQPENQHRARYLTEGSRGSVKDRSQHGFPTVKLEGVTEPVVLQVFVGNDAGRVKPHGFYQACRVTGRNTTACKEVDIDGTTVIEVSLDPSTNMTLAVDCVGILKLRNADVEARIGVAGSKRRSTRARLVFRVNVPRPDGSALTLQTPSSPILCTQPAGLPEILKKSLHSCSVRGGEELFIIGKNFLKDTKVLFQENITDEKSWKAEAGIDMELFHQNHLIVKVPQYQNQAIASSVSVGIYVVTNAGRSHDIQAFTYTPDKAINDVSVKEEMPSPVKTCPFDEQIKDGSLIPPMAPLVKREDITPMEVTSNLHSSGVFKTGDLCPSQQNTDMTADHLNKAGPFSSKLPPPAGDRDKGQAPVFTSTETLSTIREQDIAVANSFSVHSNSLLQQGSQRFLLESSEGVGQERTSGVSGTVGRLCREPASQQQQLTLLPPDEVAQLEEAVRQLKAEGFCNVSLQSDNSMAKDQQQLIQHQQHLPKQQIQQQHQVLENFQQRLFQSQIQMQCGMFQDASQEKTAEQQSSAQGVLPDQGTLFQQAQQQQQQQAALFQQANDLLPIQSSFLQQTPSHPSPPIFHNATSLAETQDPQGGLFQKASQEQVQAALFQNTMTVLQSQDQRSSTPELFHPQTSLSSQLATGGSQQQQQQQQQLQQQQLAFLIPPQNAAPESQSVFQAQTQLSPIQQGSPMEQQQPSQSQPAHQASLFQNISPHPSPNTLSPGQQPQQAGLLFCNSPMSSPDQASSLMFSSQGQMPPLTSSSLVPQEPQNAALLFSPAAMVTVDQQDRSEPMAIGNPTNPQQRVIFQEQQPMQLDRDTRSHQEQPVGLFMTQSNMGALQGGLAAQELTQSAIFATQNSVTTLQMTTSSPVQQPGTLFQTTVSESMNQPSQPQQPGLFLFGMQNECSSMMNSPGNTVSDQIIAISQSGQRESEAHIQSLLTQSSSGSVQDGMAASQNMEKIDDLLVSLQETGSILTRSY